VGTKNTERELEDFLAAGPTWMQKLFQPESWSPGRFKKFVVVATALIIA
jgi:hypothetical protein